MTLEDLIQTFRVLADDQAEPYLWADDDIAGWITEAENEACVRAGLLVDEETDEVAVLEVEADTAWLDLSPLVLEVTRAVLDSTAARLRVEDPAMLDRLNPGWETATGTPEGYYLDGARLRLIPTPTADDTLRLRVRRLPLAPLTTDDTDAEPEIPPEHHRGLLDWALFRAYSHRDPDSVEPALAARCLQDFEARFGLRPSAYARRQRRERRMHTVVALAF